jgi:hypothetical protein
MAKRKKKGGELHSIEKSAVRDEMKEQGAFDGRFRPKVVPSKKRYKRKPKGGSEEDQP